MSKRDNAKSILVHYFSLIFEANGLKWDSDVRTEIEGAVDDIIDAAKETE